MNQFGFEFNIAIAEVVLHVFSKTAIELEAGYVPFLVEKAEKADIEVECFQGLPEVDFDALKLLFEAKNEEQRFYSIYETSEGYCFVLYDQQTKDEIQQIAYLNAAFNYWKIHSRNAMALKYPMGPIIMHYLTLLTDAVLMHASCAFDGKKGRMFSGFSGVGKSTMSMIWANAGSQIINDDRLVIRKMDGQFFVYNTPMYYVDISKKAPLSAIYLISHFPENKAKKLSGALAVSKVMAFCIQNNFDKSFINKRLGFFSDLCSATPIYELGFVPNESVVTYITENEKQG
jgi:hypothetical protein